MGRSPSFQAPPKLLKFNRNSLPEQLFSRFCRQLTPLAGLQIARQLDGPVAHAQETADARADGLEEAPHLAVSALLQRHAVPAVGARRAARVGGLDALERGRAIVELHAAAQPFEVVRPERTLDTGRVLAPDFVARVHQPVRELAVVGEEEQPCAIDVQAPHRDPSPGWQAGEHGWPAFRISAGNELAFRLVVYEDAPGGFHAEGDGAAIDRDLVGVGRAVAELGETSADGYAAGLDPRFDFPPRAQPGGSQQLLEPLSLPCRWRARVRPWLLYLRDGGLLRRSGPAQAGGSLRSPRAAAALPASASPSRRGTCASWRRAPADPASRGARRRRSSRALRATG